MGLCIKHTKEIHGFAPFLGMFDKMTVQITKGLPQKHYYELDVCLENPIPYLPTENCDTRSFYQRAGHSDFKLAM